MTNTEQTSGDSKNSALDVIKSHWLNYRRKRFWAIVFVLFYTLFGFFAIPAIVKNTVVGMIQDDLGRVAQIGKVEVNPYVLSLKVQAFELSDKDETRLLAFDEFFVNFQLSSLFNWAWTFDEIRLTKPYLYFERHQSAESRLDQLLADYKTSNPAEVGNEEQKEDRGVTRLLIQNLTLAEGRVDVRDNVPATVVETQLAPINITINELTTLPDRDGRQSVTIKLPDQASLSWSGGITLAPLHSEGELVLEGLCLDPFVAYLQAMLPLQSMKVNLSSRLSYRVHLDTAGDLSVVIEDMEVDLDNLSLNGLSPATDFLKIPKISLRGGVLKYPEQSLQFSQLKVEQPDISVWIGENGDLSLLDLIPDDGVTDVDTPNSSAPWTLGIDEFSLGGGRVSLSDRSITPVANLTVTDLQIGVSQISNIDGMQMPVTLEGALAEGGGYSFNGNVSVLPAFELSGTATTEGIPLVLGQPYVQQFAHILIKDGALDSEIAINLAADQGLSLSGSVRVPELEVEDTIENQRLVGWEMLEIDKFDFDDKGLQLSQILFDQVFGRIEIREDLTTNLTDLLIELPVDDKPPTEPMRFVIGGIGINEGVLDFSDLSLPLPFATHIAHLDGTISTIDTASNATANIRLEGQVDEFGLARIDGSMNMLDPIRHTDVTVDFRNLKMSNLSPYTVQFAGREIAEGKLDLSLVYDIKEGQLFGKNDITMSDLELGAKVDHPEAASLPLGLAVGLLKDANGVIKVDLPVEGDINDPEFKIGGVIWQAISGMIGKLVSAPFKLLGKLIGIDSEDLGQFEFLAGRSDLTPPELEKVLQLQEALKQRPELVVEISGVTDRNIDVPALKLIRLRNTANERLDQDLSEQDDQSMMLDEEIRSLVETMFVERSPSVSLDDIKSQHMAPPADEPEGEAVLDELAYANQLWDRLLEIEVVSEQDLTELANSRAEIISQAFLANGDVDQGRVVIAEPTEVESEDGEWVTLELSVVSD